MDIPGESASSPPGPNAGSHDRHCDPQHLTILRIGSLVANSQRQLCLVRNISSRGLMAHVYTDFQVNQQVTIELKSNLTITGHIAWTKDSHIGVSFNEPIDVSELLSTAGDPESGWQPRLPRVEIERLGTLRAGARIYPVSTVDISQGGTKLEIDHAVAAGEQVVVTLEKFRPVEGLVRWCRDGQCGVSFNNVIPYHELVRWLRD